MNKTRLYIVTDSKEVRYDVLVPFSAEEYKIGLADRDNIPVGTGMLYDFHKYSGEVGMYTPDTRIPVDFIFIDKNGQILKISTAKPLSREMHKSHNASWVLEINAGEAIKNGIQVGDTVRSHLLGTEDAFHSSFPTNVESCHRYGPQVFVKTKESEFMYSFGVHHWMNIRANADISSNFDLKFKNYEQQKINPVSISEREAKEHIKNYEQKFKNDFRRTRSDFFIWNQECIIKNCPVEDKIYLYIYGRGWEEIEWWDGQKARFKIGVYISSIKSTSQEAEALIKKIEADKEKIGEVNKRNAKFVSRPPFIGEHFEAHGNMWDAIGVKDLEQYVKQLGEKSIYSIQENAPLSEDDRRFMQYIQLVYRQFGIALGFSPKIDENIQIALLLTEQENYLEFISAYPFMKGFPNEVRIEGYHTWENGIEGVFIADFQDETSVAWFDPFYLHTKNIRPMNKKVKIMFSGLALRLEKSNSNLVTVDRGGLYDVKLKEFLDKNPGKTAADMPPVKIELGKGTVFLPTPYVTEYQYQAKVNHVKSCKLDDKKVYKMEVEVMRSIEKDSTFTLNLYAFEHVLGNYKPKKGDYVHGVLWLTGYYVPMNN